MNKDFLKKVKNDIYLSDSDIEILKKYDIPYENYSNMKELMFDIETILDEIYPYEDLEELSIKLAEYNYHFKTNK